MLRSGGPLPFAFFVFAFFSRFSGCPRYCLPVINSSRDARGRLAAGFLLSELSRIGRAGLPVLPLIITHRSGLVNTFLYIFFILFFPPLVAGVVFAWCSISVRPGFVRWVASNQKRRAKHPAGCPGVCYLYSVGLRSKQKEKSFSSVVIYLPYTVHKLGNH